MTFSQPRHLLHPIIWSQHPDFCISQALSPSEKMEGPSTSPEFLSLTPCSLSFNNFLHFQFPSGSQMLHTATFFTARPSHLRHPCHPARSILLVLFDCSFHRCLHPISPWPRRSSSSVTIAKICTPTHEEMVPPSRVSTPTDSRCWPDFSPHPSIPAFIYWLVQTSICALLKKHSPSNQVRKLSCNCVL